MIARRSLTTLGRAALGIAAGAAVGAAQYVVVVAGMKRGDRAHDLSGIAVAAGAAAQFLILTLVLMLAVGWLFGMRLWGLAGFSLTAVQTIAVAFLFAHSERLGVHGHGRAILFTIMAIVCVTAASVWWPRRSREPIDM